MTEVERLREAVRAMSRKVDWGNLCERGCDTCPARGTFCETHGVSCADILIAWAAEGDPKPVSDTVDILKRLDALEKQAHSHHTDFSRMPTSDPFRTMPPIKYGAVAPDPKPAEKCEGQPDGTPVPLRLRRLRL